MRDTYKKNINLIYILLIIFSCTKPLINQNNENNSDVIKKLIEQYNSDNWEERYETVEKLSKFINKQDSIDLETFFLKATSDAHSAVRILSIQTLAKIPSRGVINKIIEIASQNNTSNERWYALKTLSNYRTNLSIPVYLKGLESEDWLIREISIQGILMLEDFNTKYKLIPFIIKALNDINKSVVIATLNNLNIKDDILYEEIVKIFDKNFDSGLKNSLLHASLRALIGYKLDEKTRKKIITLLTDLNKDIRLLALKVLKDEKIIIKFD